MTPLLWRSSLRYLGRHPWQAGLAVAGVALGVAVAVAIDLANQSAEKAFELSVESLSGRATHRILGGPAGLSEEVYRQLVLELPPDLGEVAAAPVLEARVLPRPTGGDRPVGTDSPASLQLLGIDPFAEAPFGRAVAGELEEIDLGALLTEKGAALLSRQRAAALGLAVGDRLELQPRFEGGASGAVRILGLFEAADGSEVGAFEDLLLMDLASAQEVLGREGWLSRIDLVLPAEGREAALDGLRALLPPGAEVFEIASQNSAKVAMTGAFRLNLRALSLLALLCGTFLIYNTLSFSVVQRRSLFGRLRALGVSRRQVLGLVLGEAAVLGLLGGGAGLLLGLGLGRGLVSLVTRTINDLYFALTVRSLEVDPGSLVQGLLLGLGASLLAALGPALEATNAPPRQVMSRSALESGFRRALPALSVAGITLLAAGSAVLLLHDALWTSFLGLFLGIVGSALLTPPATLLLLRLAAGPAERLFGVLGRLAARGLEASLSRTAVAIAALTVAVAVTVGVGTMIDSFRRTVDLWLESSLVADVYLSPTSFDTGASQVLLSPDLADRLGRLPGAAGVNTVRVVQLPGAGAPTRLVVADMRGQAGARRREGFSLQRGDPDAVWSRFEAEDVVLVSEPYAYRHGVGVGDRLSLRTDVGERPFEVAGIYYDYGADQGSVLISRRRYDLYWQDPALTGIALFAAPGSDRQALVSAARAVVEAEGVDQGGVEVRSNGELRQRALEIFDRTFRITSVLRLLAGAVAFLGVLSALMALQLEKARELGVLRATGLTPRQLHQLVTGQTGLLGLLTGLLSLPLGLALAAVMIYVINRRSFGWTLEMQVAPSILAQAIVLALLAALLAGIYPAWRMARTSPAEALRGE